MQQTAFVEAAKLRDYCLLELCVGPEVCPAE